MGTAAKNAFEDESAPLYHIRNFIGDAKNTLLSAMRIPPQNIIVPSNYKIDKLENEDVVAKALNPNYDQVGDINPLLFSRAGFPRTKTSGEETPVDGEDDPFQVIDTFQRVGAVIRESIKSGQDALTHINDMASDAKNVYFTVAKTSPKVFLPYAPVIQKEIKDSPLKTPSKTVIIAPRILGVKDEDKFSRNAADSRPDFVGIGQIMDAMGVSKTSPKDLGMNKITIQAKRFPSRSNLESSLKGVKNPLVGQPLKDLRSMRKYYDAKGDKDFSNGIRKKLDEYKRNKQRQYYDDEFDDAKRDRNTIRKIKELEQEAVRDRVSQLRKDKVKQDKLKNLEVMKEKHINAFLDDLLDTDKSAKKRVSSKNIGYKPDYTKKYNVDFELLSRMRDDALGTSTGTSTTTSTTTSTEQSSNDSSSLYQVEDNQNPHNISKREIIDRDDETSTPEERSAHSHRKLGKIKQHKLHHKFRDALSNSFENGDDTIEIVGSNLPLAPELLHPFMGRASEDLGGGRRRIILSPEARNSHLLHRKLGKIKQHKLNHKLRDGDNLEGEEIGKDQLDHILGATNPMMLEQFYNDVLPEDIPESGEKDFVGLMQLPEKVKVPFLGVASDDQRNDLFQTYNGANYNKGIFTFPSERFVITSIEASSDSIDSDYDEDDYYYNK